jgi:hypothetical protein
MIDDTKIYFISAAATAIKSAFNATWQKCHMSKVRLRAAA